MTTPLGQVRTGSTDPRGRYCFVAFEEGVFILSEVAPTGCVLTFPRWPGYHTIDVKPGEPVRDLNFGGRRCNHDLADEESP